MTREAAPTGRAPGRAGRPIRRRLGMAAVLAAIVGVAAATVASCTTVNPYYRADRAHHRPDGFTNNYAPPGGKPLSDLLTWFAQRQRDGLPKPPSTYVQGYAFPVHRPDLAYLRANRSDTTATFIGHATMLVQVAGVNVLTDPQFSDRAFMVQWAGPQRRTPLPARLDELPRIDLVVISHNHYDHLDLATVKALDAQPGGPPKFLVPLGVDRWMREQGIRNAEALDWWESRRVGALEVHLVPVQHWSARTPFDRNATLWGGWVVRTPEFSFFFAGDAGYSRDFADIGERFGGVDLALLPVGAYEPRWFMAPQHVNPEEAVRAHRDVRARQSIGIHWGTFELSDEPLDAPIGALPAALDAAGIARDRFVLMEHGQTRKFGAAASKTSTSTSNVTVQGSR